MTRDWSFEGGMSSSQGRCDGSGFEVEISFRDRAKGRNVARSNDAVECCEGVDEDHQHIVLEHSHDFNVVSHVRSCRAGCSSGRRRKGVLLSSQSESKWRCRPEKVGFDDGVGCGIGRGGVLVASWIAERLSAHRDDSCSDGSHNL